MHLEERTGQTEDQLAEAIEDRIARLREPDRNLRWEEYQQFIQHDAPFGQSSEFEIRPTLPPTELATWVERLVVASRLREVRALYGFTRVLPPAPGEEERIAKISLSRLNWLPAVENRGEGIFLQLRLSTVREWECGDAVLERVDKLQEEHVRAWKNRGRPGTPPVSITARHLLIHSLAHSLIRQLALTCGYGGAALRERLYVGAESWEMAGLLIFTSSPDADGTLGGLARQGETRNFARVIEDAIKSMTWCSSDPLCIEGIHSLSTPANGAACHACLLASETSCEEFNSFLDRAVLVGTPGHPEVGYFAPYLSTVRG